MSRSILYTTIALLCLFSAKAQTIWHPLFPSDETTKGELIVQGSGYYLSSGVPLAFMHKFTQGGFIDSTLKTDVLSNLRSTNRIGAEFRTGADYLAHSLSFFGNTKWSWCFGVSQNMHYNASFSKNLFQLTFFGNRDFAGETVDLGPLNFNAVAFNKFSFGVFHKETQSKISLSLVGGQQFTQVQVDRADFFTAANGSQLDLDLNQQFRNSDTSASRSFYNGWGAATDAVFYLNTGSNRSVRFNQGFRISLEDLGFVRWNSSSIRQNLDTALRYEGFEITNLLDGGSQPFVTPDINDTLGIRAVSGIQTHMLPFTFTVAAITETFTDKKMQPFYGIRLRAFANYTPMVHLGLQYNPQHDLALSLYGAFGGYGGFRAGFSAAGKVGEYFRFGISTGNLVGWMSKNAFGRDLSLILSTRF